MNNNKVTIGQQIILCPRCGSNEIVYNKIIRNITIAACIIFFIIPILGWISGSIMLLVSLSGLIIMKRKKIKPVKCVECKHGFPVSIEQYEKYNEIITNKTL